jgi:hypothetical protein
MTASGRVFNVVMALPQSTNAFVRAHIGGILGIFVVLSLGATALKAIMFGDKLSILTLVILVLGWIVPMIGRDQERKETDEDYAVRMAGKRLITRVWQVVSIAVFPAIFVLFPPINHDRYPESVWVRAYDGVTSLSGETMFINPFRTVVYDVSASQGFSVTTRATSRDGIPLQCHATVVGVVLDRRKPAELETFLSSLARKGNPGTLIQSELRQAATASLAAVVSSKTAEEIASPVSKFTIPYAVGTPLYEVLARMRLQFSGGSVQPSCRILFES